MHKHFLRGALLAAIAFALSIHMLAVPCRSAPRVRHQWQTAFNTASNVGHPPAPDPAATTARSV